MKKSDIGKEVIKKELPIIPKLPGVYRMLNEKNEILYIGKAKNLPNRLKTYVIEVKPLKQTKEPKKRKRVTKSYLYECQTYAVNQAKWKAADEWCKDRKIEFKIITERELGIR